MFAFPLNSSILFTEYCTKYCIIYSTFMRHLKCIKYICSRTQTDLSSHKHCVWIRFCVSDEAQGHSETTWSVRETPSFQDNRRDAALPLSVLAWKKCRIYVHTHSDKQPEVVGSDTGVSQAGVVEDPKEAVCSNVFVLPVKNTEIIFLFFPPLCFRLWTLSAQSPDL